MQNIAARHNPYIFLDKNRERTVVYYGRVSTEHEAQLAALENQLQWYDDQTERHSNWNVLQKYIDEGITGTQAKKRPAFLRMLEDARAGKFDLIVTREVCRFARNTVDTLVTTRELKNLGIEVYFVEDNIWTMDGDGELRLTIMATLAQEESRKVSERVRAGQKISRENGVLYGNGNIIGYDRVGSTYVINEEQAETVRMIFDLYLQGAGQTKIAKELCRLGRKDGHGQVSWSASKIGRILHNATYKGYNCYLKSFSNNYLEQKRIKNLDEETYMYVKGDFEPIVSEEVWNKCSEIRKARTTKMIVNKGERTYGKKSTQDVWLRKLRCSCGSTFRKNKWRTNKRGDEVFGYQCYNQVNNGSKAFREKNGLDTEGYCDIRMVGDWKLEIMAKKIFEGIWSEQERKNAILEVYRLLNEHYQSDTKNNQAAASALEGKIARLKNKIDNLISMRADGEITKEEFKSLKDTTEAELNKYMEEKSRMSEQSDCEGGMEFDIGKIGAVLGEVLDFSKPKLDDSIIDKFVSQIIPVDNCRYRWDLNFLPNETQSLVCKVEGRKNHANATIEEGNEDEDESPRTYVLSMDYSNISVTAKNAYQSYVLHRRLYKVGRSSLSFELPLSFEQAAAYRNANGQYVRKNQWRETNVTVYIDLD
ncbi:recombinase family protein [Hominisplanchenecus murintestinalis]|uniref:Recombinase family protein n=1 Tax=Hominisplanchenecus murintestinalis TaxID=2941517 RepID=A0AC61QVJ6_9FIRM|nr:recombinase family protein [Hominisplanchenecus murintestinalis]TGX96585.1 recombinase family protein [Hominisplanchenecus murintestinalis]